MNMMMLTISLFLGGCAAAVAAKQEAARDGYQAEQIHCVDQFRPDKAAIDLCREQVFIRWGKTPELRILDAGADQ